MKKIAKYIGSLALYLTAACGTPTPGVVSYHPHMPVETQRQIAENSLRTILPEVCTQYEFLSPEKITCSQRIKFYSPRKGESFVETFSDVSCSQIDGILVDTIGQTSYAAILRGDCKHRLQNPPFRKSPVAGKCRDKISTNIGSEGHRAVRDLYEALYAYCTSHGYPIQIYGDPRDLFGR